MLWLLFKSFKLFVIILVWQCDMLKGNIGFNVCVEVLCQEETLVLMFVFSQKKLLVLGREMIPGAILVLYMHYLIKTLLFIYPIYYLKILSTIYAKHNIMENTSMYSYETKQTTYFKSLFSKELI